MTVTDYEQDIEPGLPATEESIASFILLSQRLGKERVDFRFDPILLTEKYTIDYHLEKFDMMCQWLHPYTTRCIFSFVDAYRGSPFRELEDEEKFMLAEGLSFTAICSPPCDKIVRYYELLSNSAARDTSAPV